MRIALFGGSFNPPHIAHQLVCLYLLEYKQFDEVCLIPTYKHPFGKDLIDFIHRYKMCELLAAPFCKNVVVSGVEEHLVEDCGGKGYTIETVEHFKNNWPVDDFTLIVGSDIIDELDKWKDIDELKQLVAIVEHPRMNHPRTEVEVSSTRIRKLIEWREPIVELVPTSIIKYIEKHGLYK